MTTVSEPAVRNIEFFNPPQAQCISQTSLSSPHTSCGCSTFLDSQRCESQIQTCLVGHDVSNLNVSTALTPYFSSVCAALIILTVLVARDFVDSRRSMIPNSFSIPQLPSVPGQAQERVSSSGESHAECAYECETVAQALLPP